MTVVQLWITSDAETVAIRGPILRETSFWRRDKYHDWETLQDYLDRNQREMDALKP